MRISSTRLLAHHCCIFLLLSLASITTGNPDRTTQSTSARTDLENKTTYLDSSKGKCQFNLTDSSHSLEADSSSYQHRGFSQCEYIIQAPSSRFILLNFTDIRSQSDMLVEPGVWRQHFQQAAAETTTPETESTFSKTSLRKPLSDEKENVNTASTQSHKVGQLVSTVVGSKGGDLSSGHSSNLHNSSSHNTGILHGGNGSDSRKGDPVIHKTSPESALHEQDLSKESVINNRSFLNKDSDSIAATRTDSYLEVNTPSRSSDVDVQAESIVHNHSCSLKLIIEEVNGTSGSNPQVICWGKSWQKRIPIVFQYSVPIRITYVWDRRSQSGFSLDFSFLRPEEADCLFSCNNHLCLPKKQLCDGYVDCPDHSDEHNSACSLAREQEENGEPYIIKVIVIVISVIVGVIIVLALVFMISHSHSHDGAHQGGGSLLQPPHSQSSEVCRSPSGSMQDSGQYEALLHHPQRQSATPTLTVASSHCLEHQQLLQQHHSEVEQQQQQQYHCHTSQNHSVNQHRYMSQDHQIWSLHSNAASAVLSDSPQVNNAPQHQQQLQQRFIHHQQQQSEQQLQQQRQCKETHKRVSPSELYPPNIPRSADGEEGYAMSQKALNSKQQLERNRQVENEIFRPPPNKTVYDRDSPPPPYSLNPPGTKSLDSLVPPVGVVCVLRQARSSLMPEGSPTGVPRSQSLSCHQ